MRDRLRCDGVSVVVDRPKGWDPKVAFVLAHGAGQNMDSPFMALFHTEIAKMGFLSVKFNFLYMEQGRRAPDASNTLQATYTGVIDLVERKYKPKVLIAGGKSMGGRIASYRANDLNSIKGLLFLGYPLHPPGKPDRLRDAHLYGLKQPMLFISGTRDPLAKRELLEPVVRRIGSKALLHWVEGGDHSLRVRKKDADGMPQALEVIRKWSRQFK